MQSEIRSKSEVRTYCYLRGDRGDQLSSRNRLVIRTKLVTRTRHRSGVFSQRVQRWRARVLAAFLAAADLCAAPRLLALERACRAKARCDAAACPSRFSARRTAVARFLEDLRTPPFLARAVSRAACRRVRADAARRFGWRSSTPARLAFESPIAIACLVERAPCLPSLMWCISSRTNSPACVDGDFPSRASSLARSIVS